MKTKLDTVVLDHDSIALCRFGTKGETCVIERIIHKVYPYTDEMRKRAISMRGREGFSYGKAVCVLPSARFYRPAEADYERQIETERDEED